MNEPSGSVKAKQFLEYLNKYWFLKKESVPQNLFLRDYLTLQVSQKDINDFMT
jgi:hypothetical protein